MAWSRPKSPESPPAALALALARASKMSSVLERMRENWSGVRSGALLGCEGNIEMWRGFFCGLIRLVGGCEGL
jgi:hypothetical protein